jgi:hypothetical protein
LAPWSVIRSFAASDFWNTKDRDSWTPDEIAKLLKKSPWAKEITGERTATRKVTDPSISPMPMPYPSSRPRANPKPPKSGSSKVVTDYKGSVVWESAQVIRDAAKTPLPDGFEGQYVLSVTGVPLTKSSSQNALDRVRQATTLQVKGRDPLEPATVQQNSGNGAIYYMGFSKEALPITKDDKDVLFTTHMGKVVFTAKFSPKDMLYHGELAV